MTAELQGSQTREQIENTKYEVVFRDEHYVLSENGTTLKYGPDVVLFNQTTRKFELWTERNDYAGYVIVIDGIGFEFVRETLSDVYWS